MTLAVCSGPALEMPHRRRAGRAEAFADAEHEAAGDEAGEAEPCGIAMEGRGSEHQQTAEGAGAHAPEDGDLCTPAIGDAAGPGTADKRRNVLDADDEASERGVVAHPHVDVFGQDGERKPDGEINDETERREADDLPGTRVRRHGGRGGFAAHHCCHDFREGKNECCSPQV